ncbi:MAG: non-heme iron oxygenase ferredoxin subunit [candidate division Zixibacteria bacterium]|nr:non-heme iron oxygenase ferredoxin subunit [candidate division Zixibacteria bacterium]
MAPFVKVAKTSDVPAGEIQAFEVAHTKVVICHTSDGFYALENECSHDGAPIDDGELCGHDIICSRHGAKFDVKNGEVTGPPAVVGIDQYELKIEGDNIYVLVN